MIHKRLLVPIAVLAVTALGLSAYPLLNTWRAYRFDLQFTAVDGLPSALVFRPGAADHVHWTRPLDAPVWRPVGDAGHMRPNDPVLGLVLNDKAWAIPWWIIKNHHVANLVLAGRSVLITFCELCSSGAAFSPLLDGQALHFRVAGAYNGSILTVDDHTGSFWSPFVGEALHGPLKGRALVRIPLVLARWDEWSRLHPGTQVAYGEQASREGHGHRPRPGSPGLDKHMKSTMATNIDPRLPHNTLVLGIAAGGNSRAYPLHALKTADAMVLNDTLGVTPIAVFHLPQTTIAVAFSRQMENTVLVFERTSDGALMDQNSGSLWNYSGMAVEGSLAGQQLEFVSSGVEEWYIWSAYHPDTEVFSSAVTVESSADNVSDTARRTMR